MRRLLPAGLVALLVACSKSEPSAKPSSVARDSAFTNLAREIIDDRMKRSPTSATDLGVHTYDDQIEDYSQAAITAESQAMNTFRDRLVAVDTAGLSLEKQLDRELLIRQMDGTILGLDVIKRWAKDPDMYSGGITNAAYVVMKRNYAPPADRLKALIARERRMPATLAEARKNLSNPPKIYTEIAIEQIDGNVSFFKNDVTAAFKDVTDAGLQKEFKQVNDSVIAALQAYKNFLKSELLPKSTGSYAWGPETYSRALAANEMVELSLDDLLRVAEEDRQKNEAAFQATAKQLDADRSADVALASLQQDHPPANKLLETTQSSLDELRRFISDHHIITIPPGDPARVKETPPFMRSTTSASMDTPGPFEQAKLQGFYNMTLPDPRWSKAEQDDFMRQWYNAAILNVSVHEVYPGHYLQFLYAKQFPSDVRKVYGAATNSEGWAHYAEQMMFDEGFHATDPKYHMAQLQDALLRDVRFIVGIKMHTQGMTVAEATKLFESQAHQPHPVAVSEAKRGTSDALYGYYTMGKLMILKLRDDYKARNGANYSLQKFHDEFIKLGPLPLPLIRRQMLGSSGNPL